MKKLNSNNLLIIILGVLAIISYMKELSPDHLLIIIGILGVLATFYCWSGVHDFSASVDPMLVNIYQGSTAHVTVKVDSGLLYQKDVSLRVKSVSPYIHVLFTPEILISGDKSYSQAIISVERDAPIGEYLVSIVSIGADGKEHTCEVRIKVLSSSEIPTPTPTEAITSVNPKLVYIYRVIATHINKLNSDHLLIIIILSVLATIYCCSGVHDFSASVDPMLVNIYQGSTAHVTVKVDSGLLYYEDIRLNEESVSSYIHVIFVPEILKSRDKSYSQAIISAERDAPLGEYLVPIVSIGEYGKEHVSELKVKVLSSSEIPTATQIKITTPSNTATVDEFARVIGTVKNVPDGFHLWILCYSYSTNKYYPSLICDPPPRDGEWWIPISFCIPDEELNTPTEIGTVDNSNKYFEIIAVLADTEANEKLKYKTNYDQDRYLPGLERITDGATIYDQINWPNIEEMPDGAIIYDQITITITQ